MQRLEAKIFTQILAAQIGLNHLSPGGSLTFVTAVSAQTANPGTSGLAAINGAIECMIPTLAVELAPIRVNGVSPGVIETPWWNRVPPEERRAAFAQFAAASLVGRVGQPEDVAQVIWILAANTYITGQVMTVDGGLKYGR